MMKRLSAVLKSCACMVVAGAPCAALADGVARVGPEVLVNANTLGDQILDDLIQLGGGNIIVTWTDWSQGVGPTTSDTSGTAVKFRKIGPDGLTASREYLANRLDVEGNQLSSRALALPNGEFAVVWQSGGDTSGDADVHSRAFLPNVNPVSTSGPTTTLGSLGAQREPRIAPLSNSRYVVVWLDDSAGLGEPNADESGYAIRAQIYFRDGLKNFVEILVNTAVAFDQIQPEVAALGGGGFVVTWLDASRGVGGAGGDTSEYAVKAQVFSDTGTKLGGEILVNQATQGWQGPARIAALSGGGFVIIWDDLSLGVGGATGDSSGKAMKAQVFSASGAKIGPERRVNSATAGDQSSGRVAALTDGGFVVAWTDSSEGVGGAPGDTSGEAIKAQIFAEDGTAIGTEILVNSATAASQFLRDLAATTGGGFVITWDDNVSSQGGADGDTSGYAVKAQVFEADGKRIGPELLVNTATVSLQSGGRLLATRGGGFLAAWNDFSGGVGGAGGDTSLQAVKSQMFSISPKTVLTNAWEIWNAPDSGAYVSARGGNDSLFGGPGDDTMQCGSGNDRATGRGGRDVLSGQDGNDRLEAGQGNDWISGDFGDDTISGGPGIDVVIGGPGRDTFIFDATLGADNIDSLRGFESAADKLELKRTVFSALSQGPLPAQAFTSGPSVAATTPAHRILFDTGTGLLLYDPDGSGSTFPQPFAVLTGVAGQVTFANFTVK